jgi:hypothetical protein
VIGDQHQQNTSLGSKTDSAFHTSTETKISKSTKKKKSSEAGGTKKKKGKADKASSNSTSEAEEVKASRSKHSSKTSKQETVSASEQLTRATDISKNIEKQSPKKKQLSSKKQLLNAESTLTSANVELQSQQQTNETVSSEVQTGTVLATKQKTQIHSILKNGSVRSSSLKESTVEAVQSALDEQSVNKTGSSVQKEDFGGSSAAAKSHEVFESRQRSGKLEEIEDSSACFGTQARTERRVEEEAHGQLAKTLVKSTSVSDQSREDCATAVFKDSSKRSSEELLKTKQGMTLTGLKSVTSSVQGHQVENRNEARPSWQRIIQPGSRTPASPTSPSKTFPHVPLLPSPVVERKNSNSSVLSSSELLQTATLASSHHSSGRLSFEQSKQQGKLDLGHHQPVSAADLVSPSLALSLTSNQGKHNTVSCSSASHDSSSLGLSSVSRLLRRVGWEGMEEDEKLEQAVGSEVTNRSDKQIVHQTADESAKRGDEAGGKAKATAVTSEKRVSTFQYFTMYNIYAIFGKSNRP